MDYRAICMDVIELARQVGIFMKVEESKVKGTDIEVKSLNSLVSYVDKQAEEMIVETLSELLPAAGFIAEEGTSTKVGEEYNWIIDPLDGTTNFLHGLPVYSVSIALQRTKRKEQSEKTTNHKNASSAEVETESVQTEIVLGVVYEVNRDECFYAWEGSKAYLNNEEIRVKNQADLSQTLMATGFPYYDYERVDAYFEMLKYFAQNTRGVRRMGSAAVDLVYVACGRFDSFFEYSLNPWDVAAGAFIVQQAGGVISDFKGGDNWLHGQEMLASSAATADEMKEILLKHM